MTFCEHITPPPKYKTIIISDTHLGKKAASAAFLFEFLQYAESERLILNGDILEGWGMKHKKRKPFPEMHTRCIDALNAKAAKGTEVIYIRGNHDEDWAKGKQNIANQTITFRDKKKKISCPVSFRKSFQHIDGKGRNFLILHGDVFDGFMKSTKKKIIAQYADRAYEGLVHINGILRQSVHHLSGWHISPAAFLKRKTKKILGIIGNFEDAITSKNVTRRYDGVICGHIHHAEIVEKDGMIYMNSGDWVESCTALVEDFAGNWQIIDWARERNTINAAYISSRAAVNPYAAYRGITERQLNLARSLWPGTDFGKLAERLRRCHEKMDHQKREIEREWTEILAGFTANDNENDTIPRKLQKMARNVEKIAGEIQRIQQRLSPYPLILVAFSFLPP